MSLRRVPNGTTAVIDSEPELITDENYLFVNTDNIVTLTEAEASGEKFDHLNGRPGLAVWLGNDAHMYLVFPEDWTNWDVAEWVNKK